eukprot:352235-Chlamydomonas_euryale.AAC.5
MSRTSYLARTAPTSDVTAPAVSSITARVQAGTHTGGETVNARAGRHAHSFCMVNRALSSLSWHDAGKKPPALPALHSIAPHTCTHARRRAGVQAGKSGSNRRANVIFEVHLSWRRVGV